MAADKLRPHDPLEYAKLLEWATGAKSVLEIGSRYGYTLVDLAHMMDGKGTIVAIDLPGKFPWGEPGSYMDLKANVKTLIEEGYNAMLFLDDSHDFARIVETNYLGPFDFIFIDGDHTYEGARADWENYGLKGKTVVFHDIVRPKPSERQDLGVWRLWGEIKRDFKTEEFIAPDSKMGIGKVMLGKVTLG